MTLNSCGSCSFGLMSCLRHQYIISHRRIPGSIFPRSSIRHHSQEYFASHGSIEWVLERRRGISLNKNITCHVLRCSRRNKISQDPNNTQWSKSTNTFGHKILSAQGWKPGDYLGAENASHADHYTGANASHIRILLREDNLGLGAQVGKVNAETFGLSLFSGVLGRLNGKSDAEIQKHQHALRDAELRTYQTQKFGHMNFVSGGFLVGDRIQTLKYDSDLLRQGNSSEHSDTLEKSKKHRKQDVSPSKQISSSKRRKLNPDQEEASQPSRSASSDESERKSSKKKKKKSKANNVSNANESESPAVHDDERSRRKQERRAHKEERRRRKEERRAERSQAKSTKDASETPAQEKAPANVESTVKSNVAFAGNRHAVRQRYIQQKRMASMDPQAMKEIFMLKPTIVAA